MSTISCPTPAESKAARRSAQAEWKAIVAEHEKPHLGKSVWQLFNSVGSYVALWGLLYWSLSVSWWLTFPLAILAGGMLVRVFIIFHDCGHYSFFRSRMANRFWGYVTGVLTLSPYVQWKREHDAHHGTTGNLDRRGTGDIWTMTVEEFRNASRWERLSYRLNRNPVVLFLLAPIYVFLFRHRFTTPGSNLATRLSVWATNLGVVAMSWGLITLFGWLPWLIIQFTIMAVAGSAGFWLFYVQHQFDGAYWQRNENWDYTSAALKGSSFYRLPAVLQWFTGNIGYHHIHHLSHRIPNYHLERCHRSAPQLFSQVRCITLRESLQCLRYRLWDEASCRLIGYRELRSGL